MPDAPLRELSREEIDAFDRDGVICARGSHRWPNRFKAITPDYNAYMMASDLEDPPDIDPHRDEYDLASWDMSPGDVLIFDGLVVHGSTGNHSTEQTRRAFSSRWAGEDVRFDPRQPTMPLLWFHGLRKGDALGGPLFPRILPRPIEAEGRARARGPEPSDSRIMNETLELIREYMKTR